MNDPTTLPRDGAGAAADPDAIVRMYERGRLSRRQLVAQLMAIGAASAGLSTFARAAAAASTPATDKAPTFAAGSIDHLALSVTDVKRAAAFYQQHLGLKLTRDGGDSSAFLNCGERDFLALFRGDKPGLHHFSFSVPNYSADDAVKRLEAAGLEPSRQGNRVYFPDPDGLTVQVHT
jgi:catechol 2,3-dioxygenase-like lactoylglutathione lyase family enzyme